MNPVFVLPFTLSVVLASSNCDDQHFCVYHPIRIGDERVRLVTAWRVMTKSWAPAAGNNYPEKSQHSYCPAG